MRPSSSPWHLVPAVIAIAASVIGIVLWWPDEPVPAPAPAAAVSLATLSEEQRGDPWILRIRVARTGGTQFEPWTPFALERRFGTSRIETSVPWEGSGSRHAWEGVPLRQLMTALNAQGRALRVGAVNDYSATIPWDDIVRYDPLLAWSRDGRPISLREKGPLIVIYPFDAHSALRNGETLRRSVWHVNEIDVQP